jgi:ribosomal protein S18 acetylase RimI-like enzyme
MIVRPAILEDSRAIAEIHVRSWQAAYRDIVPPAFLDSLSIEQRERGWRQRLERDTSGTSVLEERGEVLGWVSAGPSRDADARSSTSELWAIYVAPEHWRRGAGQRLWDNAEAHLTRAGFLEVTLWVLKDNTRAIGFYRANGFTVDPGVEKAIELGGAEVIEVRLRKPLAG